MLEIESLDRQITDYGDHETHEAFVSRLRYKHARKRGFWGLLIAQNSGKGPPTLAF
jgi:hypothetical protein